MLCEHSTKEGEGISTCAIAPHMKACLDSGARQPKSVIKSQPSGGRYHSGWRRGGTYASWHLLQ